MKPAQRETCVTNTIGYVLLPDVRFRAEERAWRESAECDAALRPSRFNAALTARERFADGFRCGAVRPVAESCAAFVRVSLFPFFGGGSSTPARRALDS